MSVEEYHRQVEQACLQVDAALLAVDDALVGFLPPLSVPVAGFAQCEGGGGGRTGGRGELIQFTSGTTSASKGVRIKLGAIAANVESILEVLAPRSATVPAPGSRCRMTWGWSACFFRPGWRCGPQSWGEGSCA